MFLIKIFLRFGILQRKNFSVSYFSSTFSCCRLAEIYCNNYYNNMTGYWHLTASYKNVLPRAPSSQSANMLTLEIIFTVTSAQEWILHKVSSTFVKFNLYFPIVMPFSLFSLIFLLLCAFKLCFMNCCRAWRKRRRQ